MTPQQLTPIDAVQILSQAAAAAYSRGAITFADHRAAVAATEVLIHALAKPETTPSRDGSPVERGGDVVVPDDRSGVTHTGH